MPESSAFPEYPSSSVILHFQAPCAVDFRRRLADGDSLSPSEGGRWQHEEMAILAAALQSLLLEQHLRRHPHDEPTEERKEAYEHCVLRNLSSSIQLCAHMCTMAAHDPAEYAANFENEVHATVMVDDDGKVSVAKHVGFKEPPPDDDA